MKEIRLALFVACALLSNAQRVVGQPCADPASPVSIIVSRNSKKEINLNLDDVKQLFETHKVRYTEKDAEREKGNADRCNASTADDLNRISTEKAAAGAKLQELLRYGNLDLLQKSLATLESSREKSKAQLEKNLADSRQSGLFIVLFKVEDVYLSQKELRSKAQAAFGPKAVEDLNGTIIKRSTEVVGLQSVKDIIKAFTSGEAAEDQVLFDRTNFEQSKEYFLYCAKIRVQPLKSKPRSYNDAAPPSDALIINVEKVPDYRSLLQARGVAYKHLDELDAKIATYKPILSVENETNKSQRESILLTGQEEIRKIESDIENASRDLKLRSGKIEAICKDIGVDYIKADPDKSAKDALSKLQEQIQGLEAKWNEAKEQEIQYVETVVTIEDSPSSDFAKVSLSLAQKLEQSYGKIQKTEEVTKVEDLKVSEYNQTRQVELYRSVKKIWLYPVGQQDGSFKLLVLSRFAISGKGFKDTPKPESKWGAQDGFVLVSGGSFFMGNESGDADEKPVHEVEISGFNMCNHEVTQNEWLSIMGDNAMPSLERECGECPIHNVSVNDINEFIATLNAKNPGFNYRLPTEAEWEYAAKGGPLAAQKIYAGSNNISDVAWYGSNSKNILNPVKQKAPNELGLYDMSGNVWELCSDWYEPNTYSYSKVRNPKGPTSGEKYLIRGGAYTESTKEACRVTNRGYCSDTKKRTSIGFRLVRSTKNQTKNPFGTSTGGN